MHFERPNAFSKCIKLYFFFQKKKKKKMFAYPPKFYRPVTPNTLIFLGGLILVQTVCKGYQQTTKIGKGIFESTKKFPINNSDMRYITKE